MATAAEGLRALADYLEHYPVAPLYPEVAPVQVSILAENPDIVRSLHQTHPEAYFLDNSAINPNTGQPVLNTSIRLSFGSEVELCVFFVG